MSAFPTAATRPAEAAARQGGPALRVRDLSKTFRAAGRPVPSLKHFLRNPIQSLDHRRVDVLRDVSFSVDRGEFFAVVGGNGSGKSTLLRCIAGIYVADAGQIEVRGRIAPFIELGASFNDELDAVDNIALLGTLIGLEPEQARQRTPQILSFAGLEDFAELPMRNHSSGMQARLAFAISLASDADVLLFDEILATGDEEFRERSFAAFEDLKRAGRTVLYVSHQLETVSHFADRTMLLERGRSPRIGSPETIIDEYRERTAAGMSGPSEPASSTPAPGAGEEADWADPDQPSGRHRLFRVIQALTIAEYKVRYLDSFLGYLWALMQPLIMFGVLYFVFGKVVAFEGASHYPVQLLLGVVLFSFFTEATTLALPSLVVRANLLRRIAFPPETVPTANALASGASFVVGIAMSIAFALISGVALELRWLELLPLALALAVFTAGVSGVLALLFVTIRDARPIWAVLTRVLFFATPVFYPIEAAPPGLSQLLMMNPIALIIVEARNALGLAEDNAAEAIGGAGLLAIPIAITFAVPALAVWVYRRQRNVAERL